MTSKVKVGSIGRWTGPGYGMGTLGLEPDRRWRLRYGLIVRGITGGCPPFGLSACFAQLWCRGRESNPHGVARVGNSRHDYTHRPEATDPTVWAKQCPGTRWSGESGSRTRNTSRQRSGTSKSPPSPTRTSFTVSLRVMGDQANYINFFFHSACHRPAAALGLADPDMLQHAGRRSRASRGTVDPARRAEAHPGAGHGAWPESREPL